MTDLPEDLRPYAGDLFRVVREGLSLYQARHGIHRGLVSITSERNLIHDCLVETAQKIFSPSQCHRQGQLFTLRLGKYRIKLKKFNNQLRTSNFPTQAVFDFLSQAMLRLFDHDIVNLQLGYIPDGLTVNDYSIWITQPTFGGKPDWEYELQGVTVADVAVPPVTNPDAAVTKKVRVKVKPAKIKKAAPGGSE